MPRDASGTYTLPTNDSSPAAPRNVIRSSDFNELTSDYATALTDSLSRSGDGKMLADLDMDGFDLLNAPNLATAAQGAKADSALQPAAIGVSVQAFNATLAALSAPTTSQTTETRTASLRVPVTGTGVVVAVGGNKVRLATGFQIGGAVASEGTDGTIAKVSGHASWLDLWPSKNYSSLEFAINTTWAAFEATATIGGDTLTRLQGSALDAAWVGRKIYFNYAVYKVSAVAGSTVTVTTTGGGAVSWPATVTEVARVGGIAGSGTCNVSGTTVTRVDGDPFLIYQNSSAFTTVINGTTVTVLAASEDSLTLSASLGTLNGVAFTFNGDINDQIATARVHGSNQDIENISIYSRYDGYWIESQYGSYGKYRPIYLSSGEISVGVKRQQVSIYDTGRVTIGGPSSRCVINVDPVGASDVNFFNIVSAPTGFGPSIRARGSDSNVTFGIDMQGTGSLTVTNGGFARQIFGANGGATATAYVEVNAGVGIADVSGKGSATNIDVQLTPKGTGNVRFGTFTSNADAPVNGYITIKDAAGNTRKLATIA